MATLSLHFLRVSKATLSAAPEPERLFYFQVGHLANEIVIFRKFMLYTLNRVDEVGQPEREARIAMAMLCARFTAGRLYEANHVIHKGNGQRLRQLIERLGHPPPAAWMPSVFADGIKGQTAIGKYFGKGRNLIERIRHKLAFHSDPHVLGDVFDALPTDQVLVDVLSDHVGDTFFGSSEVLSQEVMLSATGLSDPNEASARIRDDVLALCSQFEDFTNAYRVAFLATYAPAALEELPERTADAQVPPLSAIEVPFFSQPEE